MPHLLGARDLGLEVNWEYGFVPNGVRAATTSGVVYLDVGEQTTLGVFDHHTHGNGGSTAHALIDRPDLAYNHLMGPWLAQHERGQSVAGVRWSPRLVTHNKPDWDSVAAAHLLQCLVRDGELPLYARALAAYASLVDNGRCGVDRSFEESLLCPHFAHLVADTVRPVSDEELLKSGLALLERVICDIHDAYGSHVSWNAALFEVRRDNVVPTYWREDPRFAAQAEHLLKEPDRFAADRTRGRVITAPMPAADGAEAVPVRIFIPESIPTSALAEYFLREEGIPVLLRPKASSILAGESGRIGHFPRVVITVEPDGHCTAGRRLSLRGLGYALERAETQRRTRDGRTDSRGGPPRWDDGSCEVADPWYDGRGHRFTIVDSPREGTELSYDEIVRIVTETPFWERPVRGCQVTDLWLSKAPSRDVRRGLPTFAGIADPLRVLYAESDATRDAVEVPDEADEPIAAWSEHRRYPTGTAVEYEMLETHSSGETTLEALTRAVRRRRSLLHPNAAPHRTLIWLDLQPCGPHARPVAELIRSLHAGELTETSLHGVSAWMNADTVVLLGSPSAMTSEAVKEVFCYAAFIVDTLSTISGRVTQIIADNSHDIDAPGLRLLQHDALRFQARYYQLEVTREPVAMALASAQRTLTGVEAHLAENLSELNQLSAIAQTEAAEREARTDRGLQLTLSWVALLSIIQTAAGILALERGQFLHPIMIVSYCLAIVLLLLIIGRHRV